MALSPDVLDYILSFLQSDTATLKACAKSHPFLSNIAERYLYVNVAVHDGTYSPKTDENGLEFREIVKLLSDSPYIAKHVRTLAFCISRVTRQQDLVEVSSVLPTFLGLTKVALRAVGTTGSSNSWPTLPEMFRLAFLDCIQMKEALLERIWFFQLTDLNNCKTVTLSRLQLSRPIDSGSSILSTALKSLSIEDYDRDTYAITRWVQTLSLHSLRLSLPSESAELDALRIPEFLTVCPNTLINLELDFKNKLRSSYNFSATAELESQINMAAPATFSKFQKLEKLTISSELRFLYSGVRRRTSPEPRWTLHSAIPSIKLFAMTAPSSLKRLTLNFHVFFSAGCRRLPDPDVLWSSLATLVAECSALSIKVEVNTRCETQGSERIPPGMMHASFAGSTQLMQYRDMGVLVIGPDVAETQPLAQKREETTSNLLPSTSSTTLKRGRS